MGEEQLKNGGGWVSFVVDKYTIDFFQFVSKNKRLDS